MCRSSVSGFRLALQHQVWKIRFVYFFVHSMWSTWRKDTKSFFCFIFWSQNHSPFCRQIRSEVSSLYMKSIHIHPLLLFTIEWAHLCRLLTSLSNIAVSTFLHKPNFFTYAVTIFSQFEGTVFSLIKWRNFSSSGIFNKVNHVSKTRLCHFFQNY